MAQKMKADTNYRSTHFALVNKGGKPLLVQMVREGTRGRMNLVEWTAMPKVTYKSWKVAEADMANRNQQIETVEITTAPRPQIAPVATP